MNGSDQGVRVESAGREGEARWTFLTNHGHVLICVAQDPRLRLRDIAARVGITERAVQSIISELESDGYLTRRRIGRRNEYEVHADRPFRHPVEQDHRVGEMLRLMTGDEAADRRPAAS